MGRTIPSVTARIDAKIAQWERFGRLLNSKDQEAFREVISVIKNSRTAIDAADEADIGVAILLALVTNMMGRLDGRDGSEGRDGQDRLQGT